MSWLYIVSLLPSAFIKIELLALNLKKVGISPLACFSVIWIFTSLSLCILFGFFEFVNWISSKLKKYKLCRYFLLKFRKSKRRNKKRANRIIRIIQNNERINYFFPAIIALLSGLPIVPIIGYISVLLVEMHGRKKKDIAIIFVANAIKMIIITILIF